jgi:hypothetical protein
MTRIEALVEESRESLEEHPDVLEVKPGGRLVEEQQHPSIVGARHLGDELQALCFAARESRERLAQPQVGETHFGEGLEGSHPLRATEE